MTKSTSIQIHKPYDRHDRVTFSTTGPSLTHQSMMAETEINSIMKKFEKTGVLEHRNTFEGKYGDFIDIPMDYHESMNAVIRANDMFATLPSKTRRRFGNDPGQFLEFVGDPKNASEMVALGLAEARPTPVIDNDDLTPPKLATPSKEASKPPKSDENSSK
jgi:phage internal scaffolding protein